MNRYLLALMMVLAGSWATSEGRLTGAAGQVANWGQTLQNSLGDTWDQVTDTVTELGPTQTASQTVPQNPEDMGQLVRRQSDPVPTDSPTALAPQNTADFPAQAPGDFSGDISPLNGAGPSPIRPIVANPQNREGVLSDGLDGVPALW